jgi:hypothetical protein
MRRRAMRKFTLETPTHFHLLRCDDEVELLDRQTIEVAAPVWLEGGRMPVEAWQVRDLISRGDDEALAEIGIEFIDSISRASLN